MSKRRTALEPERRITKGGRKLAKLLTRTNTKPAVFAANAGVHRILVHRVMNGERWRHIDVDFAIAVRDETKGAIQVEDFASITATAVGAEDEEEPARRRSTGTEG